LVNRIKALAEALEGSDIGELDLTESGLRIHIRRRLEAEVVALPQALTSAPSVRPRAARANPRANALAPAAAPDPTVAVIAPLTGVFYASASPTADPYVNVGDTIQAGQTVCIVEAMKVFNEIKSEVAGKVTSVVATAGNLVQKGDALIRVQPV
jgi:acetyl-CoA carboxylase biotin carboxyl carrier protein